MWKKLLIVLVVCLALFSALTACGGAPASSSSTSSASGNTVHMEDNSFQQSSVTIQKGHSLTLVNDSGTPHFIANGTWKNDSASAGKEAGAPSIDNVQISGNTTQAIGPFTSAGTFQLYCTIHPGMNLTVVVQ